MRPDVLTLHRFYNSALGRIVSKLIHDRLNTIWSGEAVAATYGLGFALPYLDLMQAHEQQMQAHEPQLTTSSLQPRYAALMPAGQGVCHWPSMQESASALVDEYHLPVADSSVDRLLVVHALEHAHKPAHLFREIWRVLVPGGQVVVVAPNRRRTWSALDTTPFGHGRPYSRSQIYALMKEQKLPPEMWDTSLMLPPFSWPGVSKMMQLTERSIHALGKNLGGALIVSARKQVYGAIPKEKVRLRAQPVLTGFQKTLREEK